MRKYLLHLLSALMLTPITVYAVEPCDTPIKCYEEALSQLEQANDKVKTLTAEAEKSAAKVKEAEKKATELISDLNKQHQARFEELKNELAQQVQRLATKAEVEVIRIDNCGVVDGECSDSTYNQPTYYLDRVHFECPDDRPILKKFRLRRCGQIDTEKEGLKLEATCCSLVK